MGSPRTGSTWLVRLLIHPWKLSGRSRSAMSRPAQGRGPDVSVIDESFLPQRLVALGSPPFANAATGAPEDFLQHTHQTANASYWLSDAYEDVWTVALRRLALERFAAQRDAAAEELGLSDPLVLVKEPNGAQGALLVRRLLPGSKLLFLLRDGRDVVDSMLAATEPGGWRGRRPGVSPVGEQDRLAFVEQQASLWLVRTRIVQQAYDETPAPQRLLVRYEELLEDTPTELARIDRWLGLGRSPTELARAVEANRFDSVRNRLQKRRRGARSASPGAWRQNLSAAEQELMGGLIGEKLEELGYDA
jgi:hypothetical protein